MPAKHPHDQQRIAPVALVAAAGGEGDPVLLLHGQPGSGSDWVPVSRELRRRGVPLLVPDRPGYGLTGGPAGGFFENADAPVSMLDPIGGAPGGVVGPSWGGGGAGGVGPPPPPRGGKILPGGPPWAPP